MASPKYPFEPKSNAHLLAGQFWGIPLSDGRWACGRVLATRKEPGTFIEPDRRTFLAALMNWEGDDPPTAEAIAGRKIIAQGWAHVLTIQENGRFILGCRELNLDGSTSLVSRDQSDDGSVRIYEGATPRRPATSEEAVTMPVIPTWGFKVVSVLANRLFVQRLPLPDRGTRTKP